MDLNSAPLSTATNAGQFIGQAATLGQKCTFTTNAPITGMWVYKTDTSVCTYYPRVYNTAGTLVASGLGVAVSAAGWYYLPFSANFTFAANTAYWVSVYCSASTYFALSINSANGTVTFSGVGLTCTETTPQNWAGSGVDGFPNQLNSNSQALALGFSSANHPPNAPSGLTRSNYDAAQAADFTWTFNDPDAGDTQSAYQLEIYDTTNTATPVVTIAKTGSTISKHSLAPNTLTNGKTYQWRVMTYDQWGIASPWSSYATFRCSAPPSAAVTDPVANASIPTNSYTFKGYYSQASGVAQQSFQFKLWDSAGTTLLQDSGTIVGGANSYAFSNLINNTSYKIEFIATSQDGLTASSGKVAFSVATTPPAVPTGVTASNDTPNARVAVSFTNPAGTPTAASNNVYRRKQGDGTWKQIKVGATSPYYDYLCPAGNYEYSVTAVSSSGAESVNSTAAQVISSFNGEWVIDELTPSNNVRFYYNFTNPHIKTNQQRAVVETFSSFPFIRKGITRYHSGVLQAMYLKQDADLLTQLNAIDAMTMTDKNYILKMMNGLIYRVSLSAPSDFNTHSGNSLGELTVEWTEVGYV